MSSHTAYLLQYERMSQPQPHRSISQKNTHTVAYYLQNLKDTIPVTILSSTTEIASQKNQTVNNLKKTKNNHINVVVFEMR